MTTLNGKQSVLDAFKTTDTKWPFPENHDILRAKESLNASLLQVSREEASAPGRNEESFTIKNLRFYLIQDRSKH